MSRRPEWAVAMRRLPSSGRVLLAGMAVLLAMTGCGYLPDTRGQFRAIGPLWTTPMHTVAGPVAVADTVVVLAEAAVDGQIQALGLDPTTGKIRWQVPATPSGVTPAAPLRVVHDDATVYLMAPQPGLNQSPRATLTAIDAATGRPRWTTQPVEFSDVPQFCDDTRASLCATAEAVRGGEYRSGLLRVDARTGAVQSWRDDPRLLRRLDHDLFQVYIGDDTSVVAEADAAGRLRWQTPVARLVAAGFTPDEGWTVLRAGSLYVASFGFPSKETPDEHVLDLSKAATVGFDRTTGRRRWIDRGSAVNCRGAFADLPDGIFLRCRYRGIETDTGYGTPTADRLDVTVERFDPATGKTLWQWHAGNAQALTGAEPPTRPRLSATEFSVQESTGRVIGLDVRTGRRRALNGRAIGWCLSRNVYDSVAVPTGYDGHSVYRRGVNQIRPCDGGGRRPPHLPPPVPGVGTTVAGRYVWAAPDGVHAIEAP